MNPVGLYVHIPFCRVKCKFCHFATFPGLRKRVPEYLSALETEMSRAGGQKLNTIFFGGGTPSFLSELEIKSLLDAIRKYFEIEADSEISMECNPDDATPGKLKAMKSAGINRISFGLQATQEPLLKSLNRTHDFKQFVLAYASARKIGFQNINADLIFGLPHQTLADWEETLDRVVAMAPEHISAYALDLDEPSALSFQKTVPDDDLQADMYELLSRKLAEAGYRHYEISNFAKPGNECRHNLKYWRNDPCLGIGLSAAGFDGRTRIKNKDRMEEYLESIRCKVSPAMETITLTEDEQEGENLMLGLRLREGARLTPKIWKMHGEMLKKYEERELLKIDADKNRAILNLKGWLLSNQIFRDILTH